MDHAAARGPLFRRYPYPLGAVVFLMQVGLGIALFAVFQQYVPSDLGAGDQWGGYLLAVYGFALFGSELLTGVVSDRTGPRDTLLVGFALLVPAAAALGAVDALPVFLFSAALLGAGTAFIWPASYAMSADIYPPERRGKVVGFLNVFQLLGFGGGALIGAVLVERYAAIMFVVAATSIGSAALVTFTLVPRYHNHVLPAAPELGGLRDLLSERLVELSTLVLVSSTAVSMVIPAIRPYGEQQLSLSFAALTAALIPAVVIGGALYVPAGHLADRAGRMVPFFLGELLVVAGCAGIGLTTSLPVAIVAAVLIFGGNVAIVPGFNAAVMDLAPESHRGALIGLTVALNGLGFALGPLAGGALLHGGSPPLVFKAAALLAAASALGVAAYTARHGLGRVRAGSSPAALPPLASADEAPDA